MTAEPRRPANGETRMERIAQAIYEINPVRVHVTPAGKPSLYRPTLETRPLPWTYVRDHQWAIYFTCIDQAIAAAEAYEVAP